MQYYPNRLYLKLSPEEAETLEEVLYWNINRYREDNKIEPDKQQVRALYYKLRDRKKFKRG